MPQPRYDCIVIGAGYAGLTAARRLYRAGKNILLLEARNRVGGRVWTHAVSDELYLDLGAQWIGPTQTEMYRLCREYGIATFATYDAGKSSLLLQGKLRRYKGLIPPLAPWSLLQLQWGIFRINQLARHVSLHAPETHKKAQPWADMSTHEWLLRTLPNTTARTLFEVAYEAIFACHPREVSLLHSLFYIRSGGGFERLMNIRNGAQQHRIVGGAQQPANRMAAELAPVLRLHTTVRAIRQRETGVEVHAHNQWYTGQRVIVAVPPVVLRTIDFAPALPPAYRQHIATQQTGHVIKCYAVYERPFWRSRGWNGIAALPGRDVSVCFDNSPRDASQGVIMGFSLADAAKALWALPEAERKQRVLQCLADYLGPEAYQCMLYTDHSYSNDPLTGGCYAGMQPPGSGTASARQLQQLFGRVHWAGTETSTEWNGYMEGAVRSGLRAAGEVLAAL
ncbi:MAG: flavin monoamine oxidase family protein [Lacibacter sp.]